MLLWHKTYTRSRLFVCLQFLKEYLYLDLMQGMPGCCEHHIRHLYLEDTLKLKDSQSKQDVHCFLFTDIFLVCKPLSKKSTDSKLKVIRQPFITDRLVVRELKEANGFVMIYLNELSVAISYLLLYTSDTKSWVEAINKAQEAYRRYKTEKYSSKQELAEYGDGIYGMPGLLTGASPRSSSRSSLVHSHSGSQEMNEHSQMTPQHHYNSNQLAIQQQPPRAISFELGELRNPSLVVEDTDGFGRSQSVDNRSPGSSSPRSERRAFLMRSNGKQNGNLSSEGSSSSNSINYVNQNSLSVNVPLPGNGRRSSNSGSPQHQPTIQVAVHPPPPPTPPSPPSSQQHPPTSPKRVHSHKSRPLPPLPPQPSPTPPPLPSVPPPPPPPSPPSLMSISSRGQPSSMTINKPPLVKTKNVSCGGIPASIAYTSGQQLADQSEICNLSIPVNDCLTATCTDSQDTIATSGEEYLKNRLQQKRTYRPDRRYHTADSIEHLKKEKDNSIHKRLSWNYGQHHCGHQHSCGQCAHHCAHQCSGNAASGNSPLLQPRPLASSHNPNKCLSNESMYSSSGFSSTGSVPLSVCSNDNGCCDHACCGNTACLEMQKCHFDEEEEDEEGHTDIGPTCCDRDSALPLSPAMATIAASTTTATTTVPYHAHTNSQCSLESGSSSYDGNIFHQPPADIKIDVSEVKDGISSVQITLTGGTPQTVTRQSKADLKKMKEFLLSNCNIESS